MSTQFVARFLRNHHIVGRDDSARRLIENDFCNEAHRVFVGRCLGAAAHSESPLSKGGGLLEKQDGGIHFNSFDSIPVGRDDSARRCCNNQTQLLG